MPLAAPVFPGQYEDVNAAVRGVDDTAFKWRHPTLVGMVLGGLTIDHWRIRITPDLGWANVTQMFTLWDNVVRTGNARLHEFRSDTAGSTAQDSEAITYTLPQLDWETVIRPRFERYLWQAAAVEGDGTVGTWSETQTFLLISEVPEGSWFVSPPGSPTGFVQTLQGTHNETIETIEVLNHDPVVTMEEGRWSLEVPLQTAEDVIYLRGRNIKGETSPYMTVRIKLTTATTATYNVWNTFDEHGLMLATPRLPGESNTSYKTRLQDVMVHRGSPRYIGLRNALTRDLGYLSQQRDQAVLLTRAIDLHSSESVFQAIRVAHVPGALVLTGSVFREYGEEHIVNGHDWSFTLDNKIEDLNLRIVVQDQEVTFLEYEMVDDQVIRFRHKDYAGAKVRVDYNYRVEVVTTGLTLDQLKTALEAITVQNKQVLNVSVDTGAGSLSAEGLDQIPPVSLSNTTRRDLGGVEVTGIPIRWSPVSIHALQDPYFLDLYLNEFGNHFQTSVDGWSQQLNLRLQAIWRHLVADRGVWYSRPLLKGQSGLRNTCDLPKLFWHSTSTGQRYTTRQYVALNGVCPYDGSKLIQEGVPIAYFRSGVSAGVDLKVKISEEERDGIADPSELISLTQNVASVDQEALPDGPTDPTEAT